MVGKGEKHTDSRLFLVFNSLPIVRILVDFLFLLFWSDFWELRQIIFGGTTQSDDGNDKDPTNWKNCAVILFNRLLFSMDEPLLFTLDELFSLRNEVPYGSPCDHALQKQVFIGKIYGERLSWNKLLKLVIFSRNGGSNIWQELYWVATAYSMSLQISKVQIWKKYSREIC